MTDNSAPTAPASLGSALYPNGPASSPVGPANMTGGEMWRGEQTANLPGVAADPRSVMPEQRPAPAPAVALRAAGGDPPVAGTNQPGSGPRSLASLYDPPSEPFDPAKLALPEGMEADPALMGEFGEAARALKLDRAGASRLIDLHAKAVQAQQAHQERQTEVWANEVRAHYGDSLPGTVEHLRSRIGDDADGRAFMRLMASTGLGSNVSVLRVLERLARGY